MHYYHTTELNPVIMAQLIMSELLQISLERLDFMLLMTKSSKCYQKILLKVRVYELHQLLIFCGSTKMMKYTDMLQMHIFCSYCCSLCESE